MSESDKISQALDEALREYVFSGYQLVASHKGQLDSWSGGITSYWPEGVPVTSSTLFDLGSITKVFLTTSVIARAVERGELSLESTVGQCVPELSQSPYSAITLTDLLCHASGLAAWKPMYHEIQGADLLGWFLSHSEVIESVPHQKSVYSDLNFWLLGIILEKQLGHLPSLLEDEILKPLKIKSVSFGPVSRAISAATEYSHELSRLIHGEVFDENCRALGGVAGHAGLFGSAESVGIWAMEWLKASLGQSKWLKQKTAQKFTSRSYLVPHSHWAVGWDTPSEPNSTSGHFFSPASFGALGYPGCSVWVDPRIEAFVVLLTNRVHPSRYDDRIKRFRPTIHDALVNLWETK